MVCKIRTKIGSIVLNKVVIGRIIIESLEQFKGRAWISNHKGKIISLKQRFTTSNPIEHIDISESEKGIDIRLYIIIRFGTSISNLTEQLIHSIKHDIEHLTEVEVNSVAVVVTGLISKNIARRNIEIKG